MWFPGFLAGLAVGCIATMVCLFIAGACRLGGRADDATDELTDQITDQGWPAPSGAGVGEYIHISGDTR